MKADWWDAPLSIRELAETICMILTMGGSPFCFHGRLPGHHCSCVSYPHTWLTPLSPQFRLVASTIQLHSTCFTPESPLLFSRHTSIPTIKWLHGISSRTPPPHSPTHVSLVSATPTWLISIKANYLKHIYKCLKTVLNSNSNFHWKIVLKLS